MLALPLLALGLAHLPLTLAKTVFFDWDITWVRAAPNGIERPVIGINGQWPCPAIEVDLGDEIVVQMYNDLGNQSTSLHWHGMFQNGTQEMDGASGITQCPVAPGSSFTYRFIADKPGTYWYHSHTMGQYPDGLFGPLIIHDPNPPFEFDEHITLTFMDWYNEEMPDLIHAYQSRAGIARDGTPNPTAGGLINLSKNAKIFVKPSTTYYVHIICPSNYIGHAFLFEGHNMTTVEIDGVYVNPVDINKDGLNARVAPGQRQGVLITTKAETDRNYAILSIMDGNMLFRNKGVSPIGYPLNTTAHFVYNESAPFLKAPDVQRVANEFFFDDLAYVPRDGMPLLQPVDHQIVLETTGANITGISRFTVNGKTYLHQKVPSLYTAQTVGGNFSSNAVVYGQVNPIVVKHNDVIELVINNRNSNLHPWHLHGHEFQMLERPLPNVGPFSGVYGPHNPIPSRRDTIMIQNNAYALLRFRADNPGVWSLHCHIEFHVASGFIVTIIEAPEKLEEQNRARIAAGYRIPRDHAQACRNYPMAMAGNAAGNTVNPLDLKGAHTKINANEWGALYPPPPPIYVGSVNPRDAESLDDMVERDLGKWDGEFEGTGPTPGDDNGRSWDDSFFGH